MKTHLWGAFCVYVFTLLTSIAHAAVLPLQPRLGGLAYYDPNLDVTWAVNANINGPDTWSNQMAWVVGLTIDGIDGWRLPSMDLNGDGTVVNCAGGGVAGCEDNELGYLFWEEGITAATPGPFSNLQYNNYWSATQIALMPTSAWVFDFIGGAQFGGIKDINNFFAWPVRRGDVVPIPAAVWLFASGLVCLFGISRYRAA